MMQSVEHPGLRVRREVIPAGMSVSVAARLLGVARPTISKLLHGHAGLSEDMATRLAKAYGADREEMLSWQAEFERARARNRGQAIAVRTYAPSALAITAMHIEGWAERHASRDELAVLLRRLVNSTGQGLRRVDFPGHENSQRHGWDGHVVSDTATPWIPQGLSGWEFGVTEDPKRKAEGDYRARTNDPELSSAERGKTTFVVTGADSRARWLR